MTITQAAPQAKQPATTKRTQTPNTTPETAATYDIGAEQIVLGSMLLSRDAIATSTDILTADDFYRHTHATIYTAITDSYTTGTPTDPVAITDRLLASGDLTRIGGAPALHALVKAVPAPASVGWYARVIAECAGRRRLAAAATTIAQAAANPGIDLDEAQDQAGEILHAAIVTRTEGEPVRAGELVNSTFERIEDAGRRKGLRGLTTGIIDLDRLCSGLQGGRMYVMAGRPAMGKTVAALDIVRINSLQHDKPGMFVTLEMSRDEVMERILSAETSIPYHYLQEGDLNDANWTTLARCGATISEKPLFIDDTSRTLTHIATRARRIQQRYGLAYLVIDYLQLMTSAKKTENRQVEVAEYSRGIKLLAKDLNIPIIAVSQLNRAADSRNDKRPTLADLRETGAIEQDADMVILLYREDYYDKESARAGEADFIVAKNRHGATDTVTAIAQLHCMRFADFNPAAIR